ncbi:MAG: segregation/condensation protein A [bacterium]
MTDAPPDSTVIVEGVRYAVHLPAFDGPSTSCSTLSGEKSCRSSTSPSRGSRRRTSKTLEQMRRQQMEPASDFLVLAATLLQIKSRMLLPRPPGLSDIEGEDPDDPRSGLVRQLLEYQRYREVAEGIGLLPRLDWATFDRPGGQDRPRDLEEEDPLTAHDVYRLAAAFRALLQKTPTSRPTRSTWSASPSGSASPRSPTALAAEGTLAFEQLCVGLRHREELITTFLALLEMARLKLIRVVQEDRLGALYLEARVGAIGVAGEEAAGLLAE